MVETPESSGTPTGVNPAADGGSVTSHLRCVSCQYDLHGQAKSGQCPECGGDVATTLRALKLNRIWLVSIRSGLRWLLGSLYMLAGLAATRYFGAVDFLVVALMHLGAAVHLVTPNPNHPIDSTANRWAVALISTAIGIHLLASGNKWVDPNAEWLLTSVGALVGSIGLAFVWWRVQAVLDHGIAPKSAIIARNIAILTLMLGVLTGLPEILYLVADGATWPASVHSGIRLLWLLALLVWFLSSLITLHFAGAALGKLIQNLESA